MKLSTVAVSLLLRIIHHYHTPAKYWLAVLYYPTVLVFFVPGLSVVVCISASTDVCPQYLRKTVIASSCKPPRLPDCSLCLCYSATRRKCCWHVYIGTWCMMIVYLEDP